MMCRVMIGMIVAVRERRLRHTDVATVVRMDMHARRLQQQQAETGGNRQGFLKPTHCASIQS
jgi:hypothetical protein